MKSKEDMQKMIKVLTINRSLIDGLDKCIATLNWVLEELPTGEYLEKLREQANENN